MIEMDQILYIVSISSCGADYLQPKVGRVREECMLVCDKQISVIVVVFIWTMNEKSYVNVDHGELQLCVQTV